MLGTGWKDGGFNLTLSHRARRGGKMDGGSLQGKENNIPWLQC